LFNTIWGVSNGGKEPEEAETAVEWAQEEEEEEAAAAAVRERSRLVNETYERINGYQNGGFISVLIRTC
jgi:ABC-type glycerol-3-phosphate transport system substrate-binding protein